MALDDFTKRMKNKNKESVTISEQDKEAIISEITSQIETRNPLVQQQKQTVQVLVRPMIDENRRQEIIQSTQMMGIESLDDIRQKRMEQADNLRANLKEERGKDFHSNFDEYNDRLRDSLDDRMGDLNERLSNMATDQLENLNMRLATATEGSYLNLSDIKDADEKYDQNEDMRLKDLKKHDDKNLKTHMQHDRQLANTRLSLFDKLGNFMKLSLAVATGGISTFVFGFKKRKNLQQIMANEDEKQTDILSRILQEMQASRFEAELARLQELEKTRELTRLEKRKLRQLQKAQSGKRKEFEGEFATGLFGKLTELGSSPILKKLGIVGGTAAAGGIGAKVLSKQLKMAPPANINKIDGDPPGTKRDKQGRLRDSKGRYVKDPAKGRSKQVAQSLTKKQAAKTAGKGVTKSLIKKVPLLGLIAGAGFGLGRLLEGDLTGAGMEVLSGGASMVPGLGTAGSVGLDTALMARDLEKQKQETEKLKEEAQKPEIKPREYTMLEKLTMDMAMAWNKTTDSLESAADKLKGVADNLEIFNDDEQDPKKKSLFKKFLMKTDEVNELAKEYYEDIKDKAKKTGRGLRDSVAPTLGSRSEFIKNQHENAVLKEMARSGGNASRAGGGVVNAPVTTNINAPVNKQTTHTMISRRNNEHSYQRTMDRQHPSRHD
jgi:hypothetical protein